MVFLFDLIYLTLWFLAAPFVLIANLTGSKKRSGFSARLLGSLPKNLHHPTSDDHVIWMHGVSVGEINLLSTLYPNLQERHPKSKIFISASTDSGLQLALQKFPTEMVFRCPWDFSWAIKNVLNTIKPDVILLGELEVWPNWIRIANKRSIPVAVINGRLSEKSFSGYWRLGFLTRPLFSKLSLACCQTEQYAERFCGLGTPTDKVIVTGSMKFDAIKVDDQPSERAQHFLELAKIRPNQFVFLAGSTSDPEEEVTLTSFLELKQTHPDARFLLVPRHPERFDVAAKILDSRGVTFTRRSEITGDQTAKQLQVLLIDTVGELSDWWSLADAGYVGGSMGKRGGQSMIEPASYGIPCSFGPNTKNFKDVVELLLSRNAAREVANAGELTEFLKEIAGSKELAKQMGEAAKKLARTQRGATEKTLDSLQIIL